ncbi:hypothetical protein Saso_75970 [Streptomyces asoensis]|uniref:Uncharacterized protein n=1 Tax=Streptomyces asoensis TaxID=249586 RepID=A0ABQ3SD41_9ACTN|nr:hypothetical protein GCM10010496_65200 [Streptomyces asoensis]GHI65947.1 hypothetical protein Saso_75970 [Streptomyces asoensis]
MSDSDSQPAGRVFGGFVGDQSPVATEVMPAMQARIASASAEGTAVAVPAAAEEAAVLSAGLPESPDPPEQAASVSSRAAVDTSGAVILMAPAPR